MKPLSDKPLVVYYNDEAPAEKLASYQLVVLDSRYHPSIEAVKQAGADAVLGYLSIAEVDATQDTPQNLKALTVQAHPIWKSRIVDIRKPEWHNWLIETKIPEVLARGFDGLMLDTIDSALHLEATQPDQYPGMKEAAIELVYAIRGHYPDLTLMVNRGFAILPDIAPAVDAVLAESILSNYDLEQKKASHFPDEVYRHYAQKLSQLKTRNPHLEIYTLDYWDHSDKNSVADIYRTQRKYGFKPYVATPDLRTIYSQPSAINP